MNATIVVLAGDGIGPEVTRQAVRVLEAIGTRFGHSFLFQERPIGGVAIDTTGSALPEESLKACLAADAVLLGAVGGPKWDDPRAKTRPEDGLLAIRKGMGLYANLRPVRPHPALAFASPLKPEKLEGVDFIVVRELTGGLYYGKPKERRQQNDHQSAVDTMEYHDFEIRRIVDLAFKLAEGRKKRVASVDKANVLVTSRLWRELATQMATDYPDVKLDHVLVDTAAMRLVTAPASFDVIVTENTFGDILTDEAAVLVGSMGLLPSASLGDDASARAAAESMGAGLPERGNGAVGPRGLYEPIHGSAPDIAGKGIANPLGSILSAALLLRYSLRLEREAAAIENAVERALSDGCRTADIARPGETVLTTTQMTDQVIQRLEIGD